MALIQVNELSKFYGVHAAVKNVSFSIKEGEIVGLLGLNGAGKSTILKVMGTFLLPSSGSVTIAGYSVESDADQVREMIGYLPDKPPLYDEMRVVPYLRYVAKLKNVPPAHIEARVVEALRKTNLQDVAWQPCGELSHGFRQRVGIAQALIHNPKIMILDEPINGLDPVQIVEMRDLILSLRQHHTVILSSHILSEITRTCDRILIIDQGVLVAEGREEDLEKTFAKSMRIVVEFKTSKPESDLAKLLRHISGVQKLTINIATNSDRSTAANTCKGLLECDRDCRGAIASALVGHGAELLSLGREGDGLESLFMNLVKSSAKNVVNQEVTRG